MWLPKLAPINLCLHDIGSDRTDPFTLTEDQIISIIQNFQSYRAPYSLSFDDNYKSFSRLACISSVTDSPITVYLTTLEYLYDLPSIPTIARNIKQNMHILPVISSHINRSFLTGNSLIKFLLNIPEQKKFLTVASIIKKSIEDYNQQPLDFLTEEELQKLAKHSNIKIEPHSNTHRNLRLLPPHEQRIEITESKKFIESLNINAPKKFAIPFGGPDSFNRETIKIITNENMSPVTVGTKPTTQTIRRTIVTNSDSFSSLTLRARAIEPILNRSFDLSRIKRDSRGA